MPWIGASIQPTGTSHIFSWRGQDPYQDQFETPYQAAWKRNVWGFKEKLKLVLQRPLHLKILKYLEIVHCRICREVVVPDKSGSCSRRGCVTCHQWLLSGAERWKAESNSQNLSKDLKGCSTCYTCSLEYLELMSRQLASRMFLTNCRWSLLQRWAVPGPCGSDFKRIKLTPIAPRNANSIQHLSTVHTVPL